MTENVQKSPEVSPIEHLAYMRHTHSEAEKAIDALVKILRQVSGHRINSVLAAAYVQARQTQALLNKVVKSIDTQFTAEGIDKDAVTQQLISKFKASRDAKEKTVE